MTRILSTLHRLSLPLLFVLLLCPTISQAKVLKIATVSPDGSSWMKRIRVAGKEIEQATNGRVKFKFYPGGVMGSDKAVLRKIRIGQLHGGAFSGGALSTFYPDSQVYNMPLAFRSFDEVDYVRRHMDQDIVSGFARAGMITFGLAEGGLAYMMTNEPVQNLAALNQQKIWVPNDDPASLLAAEAFGITSIPLGIADVLASLQTGLINAVAASPIAAIALQWHTQVKYITDLPLLYFYATLAIDKKVFDKLSSSDQQIVHNVMGKAFKQIDQQNRKDNLAAFTALKKQGINTVTPDRQQLQKWRKTADNAISNIIGNGQLSAQIVNTLKSHLQEYRKQKSAAQEVTAINDH